MFDTGLGRWYNIGSCATSDFVCEEVMLTNGGASGKPTRVGSLIDFLRRLEAEPE
jgi:hypothetical protein